MREWTISELQRAYQTGEATPLAVCSDYISRIHEIDQKGPSINAVLEVNPDALEIAREQTDAISRGGSRGPLHGVPVLLKDNIDTADKMKTTAGSLALEDAPTPADAAFVRRLRDAGAIILGKTNLSEWANFRSTNSNSGWSSRGGQTRNPYVLDRTPCGSSSGSGAAVAANLAVVAVGTETDGSVTCPSAHNSLVGFKPTVGTVSRTGIIPISVSQDTAGPMARTVRDAAILLQAMSGPDEEDPATTQGATYDAMQGASAPLDEARAGGRRARTRRGEAPGVGSGRGDALAADFLAHLDADFIRGRRIGIARSRGDVHRGVAPLFEQALAALQQAGAILVDPVELPDPGAASEHELTVLRYEFSDGLARYFARRGGSVRTIVDIVEFNRREADRVMPFFGQEHMEAAAECGSLSDEEYRTALSESRRIAGEEGIAAVLNEHRLDAIVAPTNGPSWLIDHVNGDYYTGGAMSSEPAIWGSPHITVPMGYYRGLPMGISFVAPRGADASLLGIAYGFEQAHPIRRPPQFLPTLGV